jgi:hypothetical protein
VRYSFSRYICWQCKATFRQYASQTKYGNTICAYVVYQIIDPTTGAERRRKEHAAVIRHPHVSGMINRLKASTAERYEHAYETILEKIVTGTLVHADETRATIGGKDAYVWVFTSLEDLAFVYSEGRDASTPQEVLQKFCGVLVSDFYAAYDSISCPQQKCLIHLMRDINEDLYK